MEHTLAEAAHILGLLIETIAVFVVAAGALEGLIRLLGALTRPFGSGAMKEVWRRMGMWLLLGLEFELAADIIGSVFSPTWDEVGKLGAIAVIRTFLNFFLEHDLEKAVERGAVTAEEREV